jgi:hypothetical protein
VSGCDFDELESLWHDTRGRQRFVARMNEPISLSAMERRFLWIVSLVGLLGPNGVFIYCALFRWHDVPEALRNPVAAAFIFEAFVVMGLLAWAIRRFCVGVLSWAGFVVLSLLGGLAFSIPAFLLWGSRKR